MLWVAKFRGRDKGNLLAERAKTYKLTIHYYPINYYEKNNVFYFIATGVAKGSPRHIEKCFAELRKTRKTSRRRGVVRLELNGETFLSVTAHQTSVELRKMVHVFYNPALIHLKPAIIHPDGSEEWEVCSFTKADLQHVIRIAEELYHLELISLRREKVTQVHLVAAAPRLSKSQTEAVESAIKYGYYRYPRKTGLTELARRQGISVSTFQAHIRKAENKLIPRLFSYC